MGNRVFTPASVTVAAGGTVTWTGTDAEPHTVTATGRFDSGIIAARGTYRRTFPTAGTYAYVCIIHPGMAGTVVVRDPVTGEAPPPPPVAGAPSGGTAGPGPAAGAGGGGSGAVAGGTGGGGGATAVGGSAAPAGAAPTTHAVAALDLRFDPVSLTVRAGDSVVWTNRGEVVHTVTAEDRAFDSGIVAPGGTYRVTFNRVGVVPYVCTLHPGMTGTIDVEAPPAGAPPPADGPAFATETAAPAASGAPSDPASPGPAGGGGEATESEAPARPAVTVDVEAADDVFRPNPVTIAPGDSVRWTLTGVHPHTITARDGTFDSGVLEAGAVFTHRYDTVGRFPYICSIHPGMAGFVDVVAPEPEPDADGDEAVGAASGVDGLVSVGDTPRTVEPWSAGVLGGAGLLGATGLLVVSLRRFLREVH